jgi:multiple sugar transport system ATP-binding protein
MGEIILRGVTKILSRRYLLDNVDMTMRDGELTAIVGDADCGKVTALKVIAGIEKISSGDVFVDGRAVTALKGGKRNVAMVFEKQGLLPHKNIFDNIAFPLRMAKTGKDETRERVHAAARRFGLEEVLAKKPKKVSEEQRHLIGIARAVARDPAAYLFQAVRPKDGDAIRKRVVAEMQRLVREDGATVIYATDDSAEALRIADKVIVMSFGAVAQAASPKRIYRRPADQDIAELFGTPPINLLPGEIIAHEGGVARLRLAGGSEISLPAYAKSSLKGAEITLGIRPPHIRLEPAESNIIPAKILQKKISGGKSILDLDTPEGEITAAVEEVEADSVTLHLPADYCLLFDSDGRAIRHTPPKSRRPRG